MELESLQHALKNVATFVESNGSILYGDNLVSSIEQAAMTIDTIDSLLDSQPFIKLSLADKNRARLVWLRHRTQIRSLFERLVMIRTHLSCRIGLVAA